MRRVAYLGPPGTYTEEAALLHCPENCLAPYTTLRTTLMAVEQGAVDEAVVPIENSLIGTVLDSLDFLTHSDRLQISGELILPVNAYLIGKAQVPLHQLTIIRSKAEAIGQCTGFIEQQLQQVSLEHYASTSAAVNSLMNATENVAAIGPMRAAEIHGMQVLAKNIQDKKNNSTRFVVVSPRNNAPLPGANKTSMVFELQENNPGSLATALTLFSERDINLTKIESRPTGEVLGSYHIFLDCTKGSQDKALQTAVGELRRISKTLKILGSYPSAKF